MARVRILNHRIEVDGAEHSLMPILAERFPPLSNNQRPGHGKRYGTSRIAFKGMMHVMYRCQQMWTMVCVGVGHSWDFGCCRLNTAANFKLYPSASRQILYIESEMGSISGRSGLTVTLIWSDNIIQG